MIRNHNRNTKAISPAMILNTWTTQFTKVYSDKMQFWLHLIVYLSMHHSH
jgi:hypothetical protein